jgi:alpha-beta hydrolase superfamily lysophospholipase
MHGAAGPMKTSGAEALRERIVSLLVGAAGGGLQLRDRITGRMRRALAEYPYADLRLTIASGDRQLAAVYLPSEDCDAPVFLLCHGLGERIEYWAGVQRMLHEMGAASLVFNYSGYGESTGTVSIVHCEEDALAAYDFLVAQPDSGPILLLGFSLGTGVAAAVASRMRLAGLILCQAFTTLREAALAAGMPDGLAGMLPDPWPTIDTIPTLGIPVLVMHATGDRLFPVSMARRLAEACGAMGELVVVEGLTHDAPVFQPTEEYWRPIADWALRL